MADRALTIPEFLDLFTAHGCDAKLNANNKVVVVRGAGPARLFWSQHAHLGWKDSSHRRKVAAARRRLGFADMDDAEFYAPLK